MKPHWRNGSGEALNDFKTNIIITIMERLILIVKETLYDDSYASTSRKIKVCGSIEEAKSIIIDELKEFDDMDDCKSFKECYERLSGWDISCGYDDDSFYWEENCKGDSYKIVNLDLSSAGWQHL